MYEIGEGMEYEQKHGEVISNKKKGGSPQSHAESFPATLLFGQIL